LGYAIFEHSGPRIFEVCVKLVLLPGLDGTGELFEHFVNALTDQTQALIFRYPAEARLGYAELTKFVKEQLPVNEPYILLGESFSGPIAVSIAATQIPML